MINSVNTKNSQAGDHIYLQTVFPILAGGKIVIPPGSYVEGTVTEVKRPGRVKGRGMLYVRFDSLTLANGVTRDFRARLGGLDGRSDEKLEKSEGKVVSEGGKATDAKTVGITTASGGLIGAGLGGEVGHMGEGAGIGAGAGAAAGLMMALLTRGPEASLPKGSTIEMILDRPISFTSDELVSPNSPAPANFTDGSGPTPTQKSDGVHGMRRLPI
jgi:type IV secretion system protein VirB10